MLQDSGVQDNEKDALGVVFQVFNDISHSVVPLQLQVLELIANSISAALNHGRPGCCGFGARVF